MGGVIKSCCNPEVKIQKLTERVEVQVDRPIKPHPLRKHDHPDQFYFQPLQNNLHFEKLINDYKANQRRLKKTLKMSLVAIEENRLEQPYFLVHQRAFYVGEWAYNRLYHSDVPHGIGRLYEEKYVSQGEFHIDPVAVADIQELKKKKQLDQEEKQQLNELLKVSLHGRGRRFNQTELIEGEFVTGKLEGLGMYENRERGKEYLYEGSWVNDRRKGRGVETTKQYTYNGEFEDNKRNGKGIYTLLLNPTLKHELEVEDKRVQEKLRQLDMRDQSEKDLKDSVKTQRKEILKIFEDVLDSKYKWVSPFKGESLLDNPDYYRQRLIRTAYPETYNGDFRDDKFDGYGMYVWNSGKTYRGDWKEGKLNGLGQFLWPNNIVYRGEYENDQRHGKGEMIWSEGLRWRGSWAMGTRHGYGEGIEVDFERKTMRVTGGKWKVDKQIEVCFHHKWGIVDFKAIQIGDHLQSEQDLQSEEESRRVMALRALSSVLLAQRKEKQLEIQMKSTAMKTRRMEPEQVNPDEPSSGLLSHRFETTTPRANAQKSSGANWMRVNFFDS